MVKLQVVYQKIEEDRQSYGVSLRLIQGTPPLGVQYELERLKHENKAIHSVEGITGLQSVRDGFMTSHGFNSKSTQIHMEQRQDHDSLLHSRKLDISSYEASEKSKGNTNIRGVPEYVHNKCPTNRDDYSDTKKTLLDFRKRCEGLKNIISGELSRQSSFSGSKFSFDGTLKSDKNYTSSLYGSTSMNESQNDLLVKRNSSLISPINNASHIGSTLVMSDKCPYYKWSDISNSSDDSAICLHGGKDLV